MATRPHLSLPGNPLRGFPPLLSPPPPSLLPTTEDSLDGFSCRPETLSLSLFSSPWWPLDPSASVYLEVASEVAPLPEDAPLPDTAPPGSSSAPITSNSPDVSIRILPSSFDPPEVSASSSYAESSVSSPLHLALLSAISSALLSALSSGPLPLPRYFPLELLSLLLVGGSYFVRLLPPAAVSLVSVASVFPCSASAMPHVVNHMSLDTPPAPLQPPPPSLRLLHPPAPTLAPPPPRPGRQYLL